VSFEINFVIYEATGRAVT